MTRKTKSHRQEAPADAPWDETKATQIVAGWKSSGQTIAEYARTRGLSAWRLYSWRRRLERTPDVRGRGTAAASEPRVGPGAFLPVRVSAPAEVPVRTGAFEVVVATGRTVRVPSDFDADALRRLLGVIEEVS